MKKLSLLAIASLLVFALLGCQQKQSQTPVTEKTTATINIDDGSSAKQKATLEIDTKESEEDTLEEGDTEETVIKENESAETLLEEENETQETTTESKVKVKAGETTEVEY